MNSTISFYLDDAITSATLENQDGGTDGSLQTDLGTFSGGYIEFTISEPARYVLKIDNSVHDGCNNRHLSARVDGATENNILTFNGNENIKDSGIAISTDDTLGDDSDSAVVTEKAIKTYVDKFESVANGKGASLIGVEDSDGKFSASNVETVLAEIMTNIENLLYDPSTEIPTVTVSKTNNTLTAECSPIEDSGVAIIGSYRFRIVYDSDGSTDPTDNDTIIISQSNSITVQKPTSGYTTGLQFMNVDCRFEGLGGESKYSDVNSKQFSEPELVSDEGIVETLASGNDNARTVASMIANLISDNTVVGRMMANERGDYISGTGTPNSVNADFIGQWYLDTDNDNWYKAVSVGGANKGESGDWDNLST